MNLSLLVNFNNEVQRIRDYLGYIQSVNEIIAYPLNQNDSEETKILLDKVKEQHQKFRTEKRVFEYKSIIISLYGLLEKYLEIWVKEYLDEVSKIVPYTQLSDKLQTNHFKLSMKLMDLIIENRHAKYELLQKETVLEKLNNCIKNPQSYRFNTEAFTIQSGNLTHSKIIEIFKGLDINLHNYLIKNTEVSVSDRVLNEKIDDLVKRRNEVAHGVKIIDLLDNNILIDYINFSELYATALFKTLHEKFIEQECKYLFHQIERVHNVFNNEILAFEIENYIIQLGDFLIIQDNNDNFYKSSIIEIQQDKKPYETLIIQEKADIAVKVDGKIKENWMFFLRKKS